MATTKFYLYEGAGDAVAFAEDLGWVDTYGDAGDAGEWDDDEADALEEEALNHIAGEGYVIVNEDNVYAFSRLADLDDATPAQRKEIARWAREQAGFHPDKEDHFLALADLVE